MSQPRTLSWANLAPSAEAELIAAARDLKPVSGLTHGYYKYPARFSPAFARATIRIFSQPGDLCLDPHVGGGTALVEALALGRHAIGIDISALAEFVAQVKTTIFSESELAELASWARTAADAIDMRKPARQLSEYARLGYYKHLGHPSRWRLRKAIEQGIVIAAKFRSERLEAFGRCAVLRTAQWALDGRKVLPAVEEFRAALESTTLDMVRGGIELREAVEASGTLATIKIINRPAAGIERDRRVKFARAPRLVLTSPPYPGVHVLYHRWQVDGRKEAPIPFMIANRLDGAGSSYYTMGDRKQAGLKAYFDNIRATMSSVAALADNHTIVVQMVAFSQPQWQLGRYLETMREVGLTEVFLSSLRDIGDGRLWRTVPGRRWYNEQRGKTPSSQEVVLLHRKDQ